MTRRFFLAGSQAMAVVLAQKAPSDNRLYDQVRIRLSADIDVNGANLDITVKDGVVTLKGVVTSERGRSKAEKLTKKVKGVRSVVNELKVDKNPTRT